MTARTRLRLTLLALLLTQAAAFSQQSSTSGQAIQAIEGVDQKAAGVVDTIPRPAVPAQNETMSKPSPAPSRPPQSVSPGSSARAAGSIRAVKGVTGILAPKQRNLEAALRIKESKGPPDRRGTAAAAALFRAPGKPSEPEPMEDGRAELQEFAGMTATGS